MAKTPAKDGRTVMKALSEIHRTIKEGVAGDREKGIKAIPPEVEVIPAGSFFHATAKEKAELEGLQAAREPNQDDLNLLEQAKTMAKNAMALEEAKASEGESDDNTGDQGSGKAGGGAKAKAKGSDSSMI